MQQQVIDQSRRFNVVDCGRRFGKTTLGIGRAVDPLVLRQPVGWFSPTYKMLLEVWRECVRLTKPITLRRSAQDHRLEFVTGGILEFWSLENQDAARGRKYRRIIVDEAAMVRNLMEIWQFVLRPTLTDFKGDAWWLSTPKGRNGFWQMFQWGQDPAMAEWASWQMPSYANPKVPASEIDAMQHSLPERVYRQEILAEFIEDAGGVFRRVAEAATATPEDAASSDAETGQRYQYVIGVDWGKSNDFTVLAVLNTTLNALVHVDRFNQIDYALQTGRLRVLCEQFKPVVVIAEQNAMGAPLVEQLQRDGLPVQPFMTTNASKTQAIEALALAFERGDLRVIPDPVLVGELQAYEMERLPSGMMRYSAPEGMHDDTVMALALAWQGVGYEVSYGPNIWG
jgi:hypothetical protein